MSTLEERNWRIDRRIPIAIIMTLIIQIAAALIWATKLDARVGGLERESIPAERLARVEERLQYLQHDSDIIKMQLERIAQRVAGQ